LRRINFTTFYVPSYTALHAGSSTGLIPVCLPGPFHCPGHCRTTEYVEHIVQNFTTRYRLIEHVVYNQTLKIRELTRWITQCTCGCAEQSNTLRGYVMIMNFLTTSAACYGSISLHFQPSDDVCPQKWNALRKDAVTLMVALMFLLGISFTFLDPCPQHWSETPMLACACAITLLTFVPNMVSIVRAEDPWIKFLQATGFRAAPAPSQGCTPWSEFKDSEREGASPPEGGMEMFADAVEIPPGLVPSAVTGAGKTTGLATGDKLASRWNLDDEEFTIGQPYPGSAKPNGKV